MNFLFNDFEDGEKPKESWSLFGGPEDQNSSFNDNPDSDSPFKFTFGSESSTSKNQDTPTLRKEEKNVQEELSKNRSLGKNSHQFGKDDGCLNPMQKGLPSHVSKPSDVISSYPINNFKTSTNSDEDKFKSNDISKKSFKDVQNRSNTREVSPLNSSKLIQHSDPVSASKFATTPSDMPPPKKKAPKGMDNNDVKEKKYHLSLEDEDLIHKASPKNRQLTDENASNAKRNLDGMASGDDRLTSSGLLSKLLSEQHQRLGELFLKVDHAEKKEDELVASLELIVKDAKVYKDELNGIKHQYIGKVNQMSRFLNSSNM